MEYFFFKYLFFFNIDKKISSRWSFQMARFWVIQSELLYQLAFQSLFEDF